MPIEDDETPIAAPVEGLPGTWEVDGEELLADSVVETETAPSEEQQGAEAPRSPRAQSAETPPPVERIVEAMLFVGGPPLTAGVAKGVIRGLTPERFSDAIDVLNRSYRAQGRPYLVRPEGEGYVLAMRPVFRSVRERLFGGPREARLSQPALDVLALVAYRQPVGKAEVDAVRGADSGSVLRQLVRLGLVVVSRRGDAGRRDVAFGTTPRFLELFGLSSADDLPRLGDTQPV